MQVRTYVTGRQGVFRTKNKCFHDQSPGGVHKQKAVTTLMELSIRIRGKRSLRI